MEPYIQSVPILGLGEAPHWNVAKQELYYVDNSVTGQSIHRYVPGTGEHTQVRINEDRASIVIPVEGEPNKYMISVGKTLQIMEWDGISSEPTSLTHLHTLEPDRPRGRVNDGKCDKQGRLWVGTLNEISIVAAHLFRVTNSVETMLSGLGISNGMAWNSDESLMYYIDTITRRVDVFDFDRSAGDISNRRTVYNFNTVGERGSPDGMNIDADGNIWVACFGGTQVIQVDPTTGQKIRTVPMPAENITSIAFGGPNLDVMYVTSAITGLTGPDLGPSAGALFQITNLGVRGMGGGNNFRYADVKR